VSCKVLTDGQGVTVITCSRGRTRARCQTTGCTGESVALCDYPVKVYGRSTTCDRRMCKSCRHPQRPNIDYCPVHHRFEKAKVAP
jgi:hypothetical protein